MIEETTSLAMIFSNKLSYEKGWEAKEKTEELSGIKVTCEKLL